MTDQTITTERQFQFTTERMLNQDIDKLSMAVDKACAQIDRLQAEKAELLAAAKWAAMEWRLHGQLTDSCLPLEAAIAKCEATS